MHYVMKECQNLVLVLLGVGGVCWFLYPEGLQCTSYRLTTSLGGVIYATVNSSVFMPVLIFWAIVLFLPCLLL